MKLKKAKLYSRKSLSLFLAAVMLIMTCSVAFGISVAAASTSVLDELVTALQCDAVLALVDDDDDTVTYTVSAAESSSSTYHTTNIEADSYEDYAQLVYIMNLIMSEADYLVLQANGYTSSISKSNSTVSGENMYSIHNQLSSKISGAMDDIAYVDYSIDAVMELFFYSWSYDSDNGIEMDGLIAKLSYGTTTSYSNAGGSFSSGYNPVTTTVNIQTDDFVGYLSKSASNALNYANIPLKTSYVTTMTRVSSSTSSWGSTSYIRAWVFDDSGDIANAAGGTTSTTTADDAMVTAANLVVTEGNSAVATYPDFTTIVDAMLSEEAGVADALTEAYDDYLDAVDALELTFGDWDNDTTDATTVISDMFTYYSDYEKFVANYESALALAEYIAYAKILEAFQAENEEYGTYVALNFGDTYDSDIYVDYSTYMATFNLLSEDQVTYFFENDEYELSLGYNEEFTENINAYYAQQDNDSLDALVATYDITDDEFLAAMSTAEKSYAYTSFNTLLKSVEAYSDDVTDDIFTAEELATYYEYKSYFQTVTNSAVEFFITYSGDISKVDSEELLEIFTTTTFDTQYAALTSLYNTVAAATSTDYADSLLTDIIADADDLYDYVMTELGVRFDAQVDLAYSVYLSVAESDGSVDFDVQTYWDLQSSVGLILTDIYDKLDEDGTAETYLSVELDTIAHYETLFDNVIPEYQAYAEDYGFDNYGEIDYEYADREVTEDDVLKTEDYVVTDDVLEDVIETVDDLLTDSDVLAAVADLLGMDTDGVTSLFDMIIPMIEDMLFTDDIINTVVELLYPLIQGEFDDVWSTLPTTYYYEDMDLDLALTYNEELIDILYDGKTLTTPYTFSENAGPSSFAGTATNVAIYPSSLAKLLVESCGYSSSDEIIVALTAAGTNWSSSYICTDGSLDLDWGVDAAIAAIDAAIADGTYDEAIHGTKLSVFTTVMGNALEGLYPILAALLLNQTWDFWYQDMATAKGTYEYYIYVTTMKLALTIGIDLNLGATANNGYINAVGAIYETLGYYGYADQDTVESISNGVEMVEMLFTDVYAAIENLLATPLTNILNVIPEAVYSLVFDMIPAVLSQLQTTIYYNAYADTSDLDNSLATIADYIGMVDVPGYTYALGDGVAIDVGDMFDLSTMGIDTTQGLTGLLKSVGLDIYGLDLDEGLLASLGTMELVETKRTSTLCDSEAGYAKTVVADTTAVFYYLLETILNSTKVGGGLYDILEVFMDEDAVNDISDMITGILKVEDGSTDIIAAICELFDQTKYEDALYFTLAAVESTYVEEYDENGDLIGEFDDLYSQYWTEEQAEYIVDDLLNYVLSILEVLGIDLEETATDLINDLLSDVFTTSTIDSLLELVVGYVGEYLTDETIAMIIELVDDIDLIDGVDVAAIVSRLDGSYDYSELAYEGSDRDAFMAIIADYLTPFVPVLKFILITDEDLTIYDESITLYAYNGYESAIVPLFEALGCDLADFTDYDTLAGLDGTEFINALIAPVMGLLDRIDSDEEDLFTVLLGILPNILYFVDQNGLNVVIENILRPVYAILDTIRPIYDIDLSVVADINVIDIVEGLISGLGLEEYIDISISEILELLFSVGESEVKDSITGETYNYFVISEENYAHVISAILGYVSSSAVILENEYIQTAIQVIASLAVLVDEEAYPELYEFLTGLGEAESDELVLFLMYYIVYGTEEGIAGFDALVDGLLAYTGLDAEGQEQVLALAAGLINAIATFSPEDVQAEIAANIAGIQASLTESFTTMGNNISDMFSGLQDSVNGTVTDASEAFATAMENAQSTLETIMENLGNIGDNIQDAVDDVVDQVTDAATTSTNAFVAFFQEIFAKIKAFFDSLFSF